MKNFNKIKNSGLFTYSLRCGEGEESNANANANANETPGNSENAQNQIDINSNEFKDAVSNAAKTIVAKETDGLKNKNSDLIDRLNKANENAKQFEGMDIEKIKTMNAMFEKDEEMKLISEGKIDEVIQKRTDAINAKFHDENNQLKQALESAQGNEVKYKTELDQNKIRNELTKFALKSGARKDAIDDIVRRGFDTFSINESGEIESRDQFGELKTTEENFILNPERFVESLKYSNSYYWESSESGDTFGSSDREGGKNADALVASAATSENFSIENYRKARKKQSGEEYHQRGR